MAKVLVTGGAGYVGSHVCKALAADGYTPVCVDTLENGHRWAVQWGPLETVDTRDETGLTAVFETHRPSAVMHFAGYIEVGESVRQPLKYYRNNIEGITALLSVMQRFEVQPFVFSSMAAVYGVPDATPIPETHPLRPMNPYGASKFTGERILFDHASTGAVRAVPLRYFNAAGASPDGEIGEAHDPETHLIPNAIRATYDPDFTFDMFGTDFDTRDGTAVRDYIHVCDLASAHVVALAYLLEGGESHAFNLGTGHGATVQEVVDTCATVLGRAPRHRRAVRRAGDPRALVADSQQARRVLGWQPTMSDLETIIATADRWYLPHRVLGLIRRLLAAHTWMSMCARGVLFTGWLDFRPICPRSRSFMWPRKIEVVSARTSWGVYSRRALTPKQREIKCLARRSARLSPAAPTPSVSSTPLDGSGPVFERILAAARGATAFPTLPTASPQRAIG